MVAILVYDEDVSVILCDDDEAEDVKDCVSGVVCDVVDLRKANDVN